jgi:hypothetical protein
MFVAPTLAYVVEYEIAVFGSAKTRKDPLFTVVVVFPVIAVEVALLVSA